MSAQIWTNRVKPEPWPILALVKVEKRQTKRLRKFTLKHFMAFTINKNLNVASPENPNETGYLTQVFFAKKLISAKYRLI